MLVLAGAKYPEGRPVREHNPGSLASPEVLFWFGVSLIAFIVLRLLLPAEYVPMIAGIPRYPSRVHKVIINRDNSGIVLR